MQVSVDVEERIPVAVGNKADAGRERSTRGGPRRLVSDGVPFYGHCSWRLLLLGLVGALLLDAPFAFVCHVC